MPIKTAYLRYAVCGCCLCIKNANCYGLFEHQRCGTALALIFKFLQDAVLARFCQRYLLDTLHGVCQKIFDAATDAEVTSKEKYITKQKLIESADDMNTQEQLDAMDRNYDRRNQERWQDVLYFAVVSFSVVGIAIGSPIAIKNVRKLLSAA